MAVGQGQLMSHQSYLAVGRETTFGTYNTASAALPFMSASMKTVQDLKVLEQVETSRTMSKSVRMGRVIDGELECYADAHSNAWNYLLHSAFGNGAITDATSTGETTGGSAITHTYEIGNFETTYTSLCINMRKGESSGAKVFQYSGLRVDEFSLNAEIDDALKSTFAIIGKDSSVTSNDVSSALSIGVSDFPLNFSDGRFSAELTFASLTSSSYWHVQTLEFTMANALKADNEARRIGSDTLDILPGGMVSFTLNTQIRFDTTTAYDAMLADTQFGGEFEFLGPTLTSSAIRRGLKLRFPKLKIKNAGDPEIGGPDEVLVANVEWQVLQDDSSAGGYAVQAEVTNETANYD